MTLQQALKVNKKVTLPHWVNYYIYFDGNDFKNDHHVVTKLYPCDFLSDQWQPYKEPCAHEPQEFFLTGKWEYKTCLSDSWKFGSQFGKESLFKNVCKHCLKPIKAEKWVEV